MTDLINIDIDGMTIGLPKRIISTLISFNDYVQNFTWILYYNKNKYNIKSNFVPDEIEDESEEVKCESEEIEEEESEETEVSESDFESIVRIRINDIETTFDYIKFWTKIREMSIKFERIYKFKKCKLFIPDLDLTITKKNSKISIELEDIFKSIYDINFLKELMINDEVINNVEFTEDIKQILNIIS